MEIQNINICDIVPYDKNPRKNDKAVDIVAKSIKEFGFLVPIILDDKNYIVAGHTRIKAAVKLGMTSVPVIYAEGLTPEQIRSFRIMDNKSVEYADWNIDLLKEEFEFLKEKGFDLSLTGFSEAELGKFMGEKEDDFIPPKEPKYKIQKGEIWQLGNHRLMCGDCTIKENVDKLMNGQKADMVFTDPPYNIDLGNKLKGRKYNLHNDNMGQNDYKQLINLFFKNILPFSFKSLPIYLWHSVGNIPLIWEIYKENNIKFHQLLVWYKLNAILTRSDYIWNYEVASYGYIGEHIFYGKKNNFAALNFKQDIGFNQVPHPAKKPITLCSFYIINSSKEKDIIIDLFGGSGSTLIACEQTNRICYMMEIDPYYCSVIIERFEALTNKKAVKLN